MSESKSTMIVNFHNKLTILKVFSNNMSLASSFIEKSKRYLREVIVKIGLEIINVQEEVILEILLDSNTTDFVISLKFIRKQRFKLMKIERFIYVRNVDGTFNKEGPIEHKVEVNIFYKGHRKRMEINVIGWQKQNIILCIPQLICHNPEIDWKIGKGNIMRYLEECEKQQRPVQKKLEQEKLEQEKQKEERVQKK